MADEGPDAVLSTVDATAEPLVFPASFGQHRLWLLHKLEPDSPAYAMPFLARLSGPLAVPALERALSGLVARHETLRTTFFETDGEVYQRVAPGQPILLEVVDVSGEPDPESAARELAARQLARPFDLGAGPLFRAAAARISGDEHLLILSFHHSISDGWSMGVLKSDLSALYTAALEERPPALESLEVQYGDFAAWQRKLLQGPRLERHLSYWREKLDGAPALLDLPTDRPRPAYQSSRGAHVRRWFDERLTARLTELARDEDATLFIVLLAGFAALLARHSDQTDVVIGTPVAGRHRIELEQLIGFFANTLALRVDLAGDPSFSEVIRRVRETAYGAYEHQDLPFEKLVAELNPERSLSHSPIFQVLFALQHGGGRPLELPGLGTRVVEIERSTAKFDLALFMVEREGRLRASCEYSTDLFDRETVERMLARLEHLLEAAAADPGMPLGELDLVPEDERRLLERWSRSERGPEGLRCAHELVVEQARRTPQAPALSSGEELTTYEELVSSARGVAARLAEAGVAPGAVVGVCAERSPELVAGVLGILMAGAAYAPLDPAYPAERLRLMLEDLRAPVLLLQGNLAERLPPHEALVVDLEEAIASGGDASAAGGATLDHLAYVLFTSGSTGRPKGVAMGHRPLANLLAWQLRSWKAPSAARTLQFTSLGFDVSFQEIFSTLAAGGSLVLVGDEERRDPKALLRIIDEERVERVFMPFVALRQLADASEETGIVPAALREVITAGEALQVTPAIRSFFERLDGAVLHNQYGPTETHVVTAHTLEGLPADWPAAPPIGRPIDGAEVHLLDERGRRAPVGRRGELYLGGVSLADGYLNRPDLTAERFVRHPFDPDPTARLYRTGDVGRYLPDGAIEFVGRADHQVKIRGFRVEPGEIEAALRRHPAVRDALVVASEEDGGRRLVAYVLGDERGDDVGDLASFLRRMLPDYMVPAAFVWPGAFPLTATGKLDRAALAGAPIAERALTDDFVAPRTPAEETLAAIWSELLKVDRVGVHDDFFALGGHSVLATRMLSRARQRLGLEIPLRAVFETPTIAGLLGTVELASEPAPGPALPALRRVPREWRQDPAGSDDLVAVLPASFAERRLFFLDRLDPDSRTYKLARAVRLHGSLDVAALERALGALVARHEPLRTTFALVDGEPVQVIRQAGRVALEVDDLTGVEDAEQQALEIVCEERRRPFDLEAGPLLRTRIVRLGPDEHVLILTVHHIIIDGWSMGVLSRELGALYAAFTGHSPAALEELPVQYADFAIWQQEWVAEGGLGAQLDYWRKRLADAPALLTLPTDRPRPPVQSGDGGMVRRSLRPELVERLKALGEQEGATLFMTLLAAYSALLSRYSGQDDVVVASPIAGRNRLELEGLIGFFVNTLALRADLSGEPSFRELLRRVREAAVGAFSNQDVPFEKLVEELNPERHLSHQPIAQVAFALQNAEDQPLALPGLTLERMPRMGGSAKFDLALYAVERDDGLGLALEYASDLFEPASVERLLAHFVALLESAVGDPDRPVGALALLAEGEWEAAVAGGRAVAPGQPVGLLHELFAERVRVAPEAPAVAHAGAVLSYGELDRRANQLAHRLRELGVGRDALVALCLEPSLELVVAVLGVLKAGGAYVPLDPDYPEERLRFVLEDTRASVLLTQARLLVQLPEHDAAVICLDHDAGQLARRPVSAPEVESDPGALAYVIYTSGSTGRPKGVLVEHRNVARLFSATERWFGFGPDDTWALLHSYAFDFSVWEMWGALLHGGRLVVPERATVRMPDALAAFLEREAVTVLNATPSLFVGTLAELLKRADRLRLRTVVFGGEALRPAALAGWFERFGDGGPRLVNMYGITETTVHVTYEPIEPGSLARGGSPIGVAIPDLELYLLDDGGGPVPVGVPGEIYVGGAGVARGYLNRPELTAERFVANPFGSGRLYRSGDLARRLPGGGLDFIGRRDAQVQIRGYRIELGEIESALLADARVAEAAVVAVELGPDDTRLAAYVVPRAGETGEELAAELLRELKHHLPSHMLPASLVTIESLPLTTNGKLDRSALAEPVWDQRRGSSYSPPRSATEKAIAAILRDLLQVDRVGIHDSFFELGGHSMLAVRLFGELERAFGVRVPLAMLFQDDSLESIAAAVTERRSANRGWSAIVPLQPQGSRPPLFVISLGNRNSDFLPYRQLIDSLGPDQPVFGLQSPGMDGRMMPVGTVEELAALYVDELREFQDGRPYGVLGLAYAGMIAYEVNRQLSELGDEPLLLALINTGPSGKAPSPRLRRRGGPRAWLLHVRRRAGNFSHNLGIRYYEHLVRAGKSRPRHSPWDLQFIASSRARMRYEPQPSDARIFFFGTASPRSLAQAERWEPLARGGVEFHPVVSDTRHVWRNEFMTRPHVDRIADALRHVLDARIADREQR